MTFKTLIFGNFLGPEVVESIIVSKKYWRKIDSLAYSVVSINKQYMRNPDTVYVLKMEHVSKINIFGLNMMVKSGLEEIFLKFLHAQGLFQTS